MQTAHQKFNEFLRKIHLGSEMYYVGQLCDAWKLSTPGSGVTSFHLVSHGDVWLHMDSLPQPLRLMPGDIAFFRRMPPMRYAAGRSVRRENRIAGDGRLRMTAMRKARA